jgi:signal transduction histidine kinase
MQNLRLDAEVRHQTPELAASRDRVVQAQDVERRRIQQVLHDGVQQEIVALSAKVGLIRAQLRRGDAGVTGSLESMQRDLAAALQDVREIAYAIHPPVLSDRGLLEAVEAQASRLAVPMAVRADATIFTKLGLTTEQQSHRRVTAVLVFLRDAGLRT